MKKKVIVGIISVFVFAAVILILCFVSNKETIGTEQAQAIALEHSGISKSDAEFLRVKLDGSKYEIEFTARDCKYKYEISSDTGEIFEYEKNTFPNGSSSLNEPSGREISEEVSERVYTEETSKQSAPEDLPAKKETGSNQSTEDKIFNAAFNHAGVSGESILYSEIEFDNGIYEVEFETSDCKYEYEVSPNCEILEFKRDHHDSGRHYDIHH